MNDKFILSEDKKTIWSLKDRTIRNVVIPNGVIFIESSAFADCFSLESIEIPISVTSIGNNAFSGCTFLKNINIPESITTIEDSTFKGCI